MKNRILDFYLLSYCGELLTPKPITEKSIKLEDVLIGKMFQFEGDMTRIREVLDVDGEFVLIQTFRCSEDLPLYKCHYTHLKINESGLR